MRQLSEVLHYYLPYKLKIQYWDKQIVMNLGEGSSPTWIGLKAVIRRQGENCRPLLIPLSFLTFGFFKDWNIDLIDEISIGEVRDKFILPEDLTLAQANLCFEKHIDIFGLTESGQAIDKTKIIKDFEK